MKVLSVTKQGSSVRVLEVETSPDEYTAQEDRVYKRLRKEVRVPGFRPGKVPREILRARYGKAVEADALEECVAEALSDALEHEDLVPLTEPAVHDVERTPEGGVAFRADVEVLPELDLPDYEKLDVVREVEESSAEEVEEHLEGLRRVAAQVRVVDRPARTGDLVRFQYQKLDPSGVPLIGTTVDDNSLVVGEREDLRPFSEAIVGANAGDSREFSVSTQASASPGRSRAGGLAGPSGLENRSGATARGERRREQRYRVTLKEVCERELPNLDDEFAKDVGQFAGLEGLREHVHAQIDKEAEELATRSAQEQLLRKVVEKSGVAPSPSLVERYLSSLVEEAREVHRARKDERPFDEGHVREAHRAEAAAQVTEYLVVRRIAENEGLEPDDDEVRSYVVARSAREPTPDELNSVRGRLREIKVREFLMKKAKVRDVRRKPLPKEGRVLLP